LEQNIDIVMVSIGVNGFSEADIACMEEFAIRHITLPAHAVTAAEVDDLATFLCPEDTPYDGGYSRLEGEEYNGFPVYKSSRNYFSRYNGTHWEFVHESLGPMISTVANDRLSPGDYDDWELHALDSSNVTYYTDVRVICVGNYD